MACYDCDWYDECDHSCYAEDATFDTKAQLSGEDATFDSARSKEVIVIAPDGYYTQDSDRQGWTFHEKTSAQPEIIRCKDCKHWRQQTNYQGTPLSFGFCESEDMWASLYGETTEVAHIDTDDNHYCGYAERRTDE